MPLQIVPLDKSTHDRGTFDCGVAALNDYLQKHAARHQKQRVSRVYVLVDNDDPKIILGFYTLSNSEIRSANLDERQARRLPRHPIPTLTLGRMAVQQEKQRKGYGAILLLDAIKRCALVSQEVGVYAMIVDAKDDDAKGFYVQYGFTELPQHPLKLILAMGTAIQMLADDF